MKVSVRSLAPLFAALVVVLGGSAAASAAPGGRGSKLDRVLQDAASQAPKPQRVIIRTKAGTRDLVKKSLREHGDVVEAEHPSLDALTVRLHGEDLVALDHDPNVLSVSVDAEVTSFGSAKRAGGQTRRMGRAPANVLRTTLGLDGVAYSGAGVGIALVDSGIEPNRDLVSSLKGFWDFTVGSGVPTWPYDDYGHGTHLAGLIASDGLQSRGQFTGIAPAVNLYGLKVLDRYGRGRASDVIRALEWILANHRSKGIHVVNLSLGHPIHQDAAHDPLVIAVENLVRAGVVVVVAAGNAGADRENQPGYAGITSPGNAPSAVTVGAADMQQTAIHSDDRVAYFSSRGPTWYDGIAKPDIVAPGVALSSNAARFSELFKTYPQLKTQPAGGKGSFATLSGTSMAAAVTSGIVALLVEASADANPLHSRIGPGALKALLQYSALPLRDEQGIPYDALTQGTGKINALGALSMVQALDTSVPVGGTWIAVPPPTFTSVAGETIDWSRSIIWDDTLVGHPGAIWVRAEQWGTCDAAVNPDCENIVWGTGLACDFACENIVWGTSTLENIVWGSSLRWAGNLVSDARTIGMFLDDENIVWGTFAGLTEENIVWGTYLDENIVWGTFDGENIVWGTFTGENIVWGTSARAAAGDPRFEKALLGSARFDAGEDDENIVWGTRSRKRGSSGR